MSNLAANSIIGNNTGSAATPIALTATQVTAFLNPFTTSLQGLAPASGGGTTNFLRADGTWAAPSGGGSSTSVNVAFTDGDAFRRVTITDAGVNSSTLIQGSIIRPTTTDLLDQGYIYIWNVISRGSGTFDILIACTDMASGLADSVPPNETIQFIYRLG
jgi:hypothetical protein